MLHSPDSNRRCEDPIVVRPTGTVAPSVSAEHTRSGKENSRQF
jgi:hypothetical protein